MKPGTFPAALFGKTTATLGLPAGIPALRAQLHGDRDIRCGEITLSDPHPVAALCRALKASGRPDSAVLVSWSDGRAALLIESFRDSAWSPEQLAT